jgi:hypothetical protein
MFWYFYHAYDHNYGGERQQPQKRSAKPDPSWVGLGGQASWLTVPLSTKRLDLSLPISPLLMR